jgi:hypothetical protein
LRIEKSRIKDFGRLNKCKSLKILALPDGDLNELEHLRNLGENFVELDLSQNHFTFSISFTNFTNLKKLDVSNNDLSEIEGFRYLNELEHLNISNNEDISDISPIYNLSNLKYLNLRNLDLISAIQLFKLKVFRTQLSMVGRDIKVLKIPFLDKIDVIFEEIKTAKTELVTGDSFEFKQEFEVQRADFGITFCSLFEFCFLQSKKEKKTGERSKDETLILQTTINEEQSKFVTDLTSEISDVYKESLTVKDLRVYSQITAGVGVKNNFEKTWSNSELSKYKIGLSIQGNIVRLEINLEKNI